MAVQKKSLIGSRTDNKTAAQPVTQPAAIGTSKGLTANALLKVGFQKKAKRAGFGPFNTLKKKR